MKNTFVIQHRRLINLHNSTDGFNDDGRPAWRISVCFPDEKRGTFPIPFARRPDAEQGLKAILRLMTLEGSYREIRERIADIGAKRILQVICEAMAW